MVYYQLGSHFKHQPFSLFRCGKHLQAKVHVSRMGHIPAELSHLCGIPDLQIWALGGSLGLN